jgi:hypothetical protein
MLLQKGKKKLLLLWVLELVAKLCGRLASAVGDWHLLVVQLELLVQLELVLRYIFNYYLVFI